MLDTWTSNYYDSLFSTIFLSLWRCSAKTVLEDLIKTKDAVAKDAKRRQQLTEQSKHLERRDQIRLSSIQAIESAITLKRLEREAEAAGTSAVRVSRTGATVPPLSLANCLHRDRENYSRSKLVEFSCDGGCRCRHLVECIFCVRPPWDLEDVPRMKAFPLGQKAGIDGYGYMYSTFSTFNYDELRCA